MEFLLWSARAIHGGSEGREEEGGKEEGEKGGSGNT